MGSLHEHPRVTSVLDSFGTQSLCASTSPRGRYPEFPNSCAAREHSPGLIQTLLHTPSPSQPTLAHHGLRKPVCSLPVPPTGLQIPRRISMGSPSYEHCGGVDGGREGARREGTSSKREEGRNEASQQRLPWFESTERVLLAFPQNFHSQN